MTRSFSRGTHAVAKRKLRGSEFIYLFLFAFLLAIPMVWIASLRTVLVRYGYRVVELKSEEAAMLDEQAYLRAELARLTRPERVFRQMEKRGLVPRQEQIVVYTTRETLVAEAARTEGLP